MNRLRGNLAKAGKAGKLVLGGVMVTLALMILSGADKGGADAGGCLSVVPLLCRLQRPPFPARPSNGLAGVVSRQR